MQHSVCWMQHLPAHLIADAVRRVPNSLRHCSSDCRVLHIVIRLEIRCLVCTWCTEAPPLEDTASSGGARGGCFMGRGAVKPDDAHAAGWPLQTLDTLIPHLLRCTGLAQRQPPPGNWMQPTGSSTSWYLPAEGTLLVGTGNQSRGPGEFALRTQPPKWLGIGSTLKTARSADDVK